MKKYYDTIVNAQTGVAISGAQVQVNLGTSLATIYSDNGITPITNPVTTDANGFFQFYVADGRYNLSIYANGVLQKTINDVLIYDNTAATGASSVITTASDSVQAELNSNVTQLNLKPQSIANIAALRLATSATLTNNSVNVIGYYTTAVNTTPDGGGGLFVYDSTDTTSADNGGTIIVDASSRRWKRKFNGFISIKWFGAKDDGTTDNALSIQNAATYAGIVNASLYVPCATTSYIIATAITVPDNVTIYGDGWDSLIYQTTLNQSVFNAGNQNTFKYLHLKVVSGNDTAFVNCIFAQNVNNLVVENNFLELADQGAVGVHIRGVRNSKISKNIIFNGQWTTGVNAAASAADILLYSSTASERHVIEGNHCLSNNSQGIFVDALGYDGDILIQGNVCVTLDTTTCTATGTWSLVATGGVRRHGIVVGYNASSVSGPRAVINGNICRNTRWTGIYKQGVSSGAVIISNNLCDLNGYQSGNTLAGGIYLNQSGYELVEGNTITNYQNVTTGDTGAITVVSGAVVTSPSDIRRNKIITSAGHGVFLKTQSAFVNVDGNTFYGCADADIKWNPSPGLATVGGHRIVNNYITRSTGTLKSGINLSIQASTLVTIVKNNTIKGDDNTTVNAANAGIFRTQADSYVQILNNEISNFYYAVYGANFFTGGRMQDVQIEGNIIKDCNTGFALSASASTQTVPLTNNKFINVTTETSGPLGAPAGRIVTRQGDNFVTQTTASPTLGTWAIGDRSANSAPAVGSPKGWLCTVAGAPGTWVSEGNL